MCLEEPKFSTIHKDISLLEDVYSYLDRKGHTFQACSAMKLMAEVHHSSLDVARQATLHEYFKN